MRAADEPEMVGLHDPTHDPPRRLREKPQPQPMPDDGRALRNRTPETAGHRTSPVPPPLQSRLARQSQRRPLQLNAMDQPRSLVHELARCGTLFGGAGRLAADRPRRIAAATAGAVARAVVAAQARVLIVEALARARLAAA